MLCRHAQSVAPGASHGQSIPKRLLTSRGKHAARSIGPAQATCFAWLSPSIITQGSHALLSMSIRILLATQMNSPHITSETIMDSKNDWPSCQCQPDRRCYSSRLCFRNFVPLHTLNGESYPSRFSETCSKAQPPNGMLFQSNAWHSSIHAHGRALALICQLTITPNNSSPTVSHSNFLFLLG